MKLPDIFFCHGSTALVGQGLLIVAVLKSHSDTPHMVALLWMMDQPVADPYLPTHNTRNRHPCPWQDSDPQSQQASIFIHGKMKNCICGPVLTT